jgi:hypothetical protein
LWDRHSEFLEKLSEFREKFPGLVDSVCSELVDRALSGTMANELDGEEDVASGALCILVEHISMQ